MERKYFEDISIFQGIKEFLTPHGMMRAENVFGENIYQIRRNIGNAWCVVGYVQLKCKNPSCRSIFEKFDLVCTN